MKLFASILFVAAFAVVTPGHAQTSSPGAHSATDDVVNSMSGIHRPTPKPDAAAATSTTTGPMEAGLYKDAKGKDAATAFAPTDTVYLVCKNVSGKKGDKLGVAWYSGSGAKSKKLYATEKGLPDAGTYNPSYNLAPAKGGSPAGAYHVDFSMDSKVVRSLSFTVK